MTGRVSNYLTYLALAIPRAVAIPSDVVFSMTDPPFAGLAGALVSAVTGRPFLYNIQDLYPEMAVGGEIVRPGAWVRCWERMHRRALHRAARVIVIGDDMRDRIIQKGVDPARIAVVRAGVNVPLELVPSPGHSIAQEIRSGFRFVALHGGNLGFYGAWETLLDAARHLGTDGLAIVFVGEGAQKERSRITRAIAAGRTSRALFACPSCKRSTLHTFCRRYPHHHREAGPRRSNCAQ